MQPPRIKSHELQLQVAQSLASRLRKLSDQPTPHGAHCDHCVLHLRVTCRACRRACVPAHALMPTDTPRGRAGRAPRAPMVRRGAALVLVLAAALARSAAAVTQTMTPYGPMVMTTYPNGVTRDPLGEPAGYLPTATNASGAATSWVLSSQATPAVLSAATSGQVRAYTHGCGLRPATRPTLGRQALSVVVYVFQEQRPFFSAPRRPSDALRTPVVHTQCAYMEGAFEDGFQVRRRQQACRVVVQRTATKRCRAVNALVLQRVKRQHSVFNSLLRPRTVHQPQFDALEAHLGHRAGPLPVAGRGWRRERANLHRKYAPGAFCCFLLQRTSLSCMRVAPVRAPHPATDACPRGCVAVRPQCVQCWRARFSWACRCRHTRRATWA